MATAPSGVNRTPSLVAIVSGAVLAISSFLEWAAVDVTPEFTVAVKGTDGSDGWITLVCGALAVVGGGMAYTAGARGKLPGVLAIVGGAIGALVGVINWGEAEGYQSYGLYLVIAGGLGAVVGGVMLLRGRTADTGTPLPPADAPPGGTPTA